MIEAKFQPHEAIAVIDAQSSVLDLSLATQMLVNWLMIHTAHRFRIVRKKTPMKDCVLTATPLCNIIPMPHFNNNSTLGAIVKEGIFPESLSQRFLKPGAAEKTPIEGITKIHAYKGETVVPMEGVNPRLSINAYAFDFISDLSIPFWIKGATEFRHQYSFNMCENWYNVCLNKQELEQFGTGYDVGIKICDLLETL